jgi:hypothetical protein
MDPARRQRADQNALESAGIIFISADDAVGPSVWLREVPEALNGELWPTL